jgi:uncharacterized OB-fold protein
LFEPDTLDPEALYPPLPEPDELTSFFWDGVAEHRLLIQRCDACGFYIHAPRQVCSQCLATTLSPAEVSGDAILSTWTFPNQPFDPYYHQHLPYVLAVVELVEQPGLKLLTNIVDCAKEDLRIDLPVRVTFREVAPNCTLPLFAPAPAAVPAGS